MVLPDKVTSLKADQLRDECLSRDIAFDGLNREQMIQEIMFYEASSDGSGARGVAVLEVGH